MANFLSALFGGRKSPSVAGIDIGSSSIKIVQLARKGGKAILETYGELAIGPYSGVEIGQATNLPPEKLADAIKDLMREAKVTAQNCAISIPFGASLISTIEMPAVPDKQLEQMIPIEARKYIPVPLTEVALDWSIVPKATVGPEFSETGPKQKPGDKVDILLVAIHKETLARYSTIVKQAALNASFFEIEIFSAIRAVIDQDTQTHMIIDIGASSAKVYVVERGVIRGSHIINRGSQDVTASLARGLNISFQQAEVYKRSINDIPEQDRQNAVDSMSLSLDYVFSEASRILVNYEKRYAKNIPVVTLIGGGAQQSNVLELAQAHLQNQIVLGDPFNKTQAPAFLENILKETGPEFAVATGIALRKLQEIR